MRTAASAPGSIGADGVLRSRPMPAVILLWGAPAAGKTSVARCLVEGYRARTGHLLPRLGTDDIRRAIIGAEFIAEVRNSVYDGIVSICEKIAEAGLDCLVDGNYLDGWRRRQIVDVCFRTSSRLISAHVRCDLDERLRRNALRPASEQVPEPWVRQAHELAERNVGDASIVVDGVRETPESAATRLLDALKT